MQSTYFIRARVDIFKIIYAYHSGQIFTVRTKTRRVKYARRRMRVYRKECFFSRGLCTHNV